MFPRTFTEDDVRRRLPMPAAIEALDEAFRQWAAGNAQNIPRTRARAPGAVLHVLSASAAYLGLMGWKAYTTTSQGARFHVGVYSIASGEPVALFEANHLGQIRTGAATGVATRLLSRPESSVVGIFGTGFQARTQVQAVCHVRTIRKVFVYGRDAQKRRAFAEELSQELQIEVSPAAEPRACVRGCDVVICATTSRQPVFEGAWLEPGTHLNLVGSNVLTKAEADVETIRRASRVVCDSIDQCQIEAGDFVAALEAGTFTWDRAIELRDALADVQPGRSSAEEITLFKSVGLGLEDVAAAGVVLQDVVEHGP